MVLGWDIGGVNTKAALVAGGRIVGAQGRAFELQREPAALAGILRALAGALCGAAGPAPRHAVTMTAELSQMFRSKREGVRFVLDAVAEAFPSASVRVYATDGRFLVPDAACDEPLQVAAANWAATARVVARRHPDAVLIDVGTTTTDVIPILNGQVAAAGWTDPDRLASGELVYTGALRTPAEAIASHVWVHGKRYGVSAESFALAGDVHVWRSELSPVDYTVPTPDGRPAERSFAGERLRRVICADPELVDESGVDEIARALAQAQVARMTEAVIRVRGTRMAMQTAVVTGAGAFLGAAAARAAGLDVVFLADEFGADAAQFAPAAAVAWLLDAEEPAPVERRGAASSGRARASVVDVVVKIGGSLLAHPAALDEVLASVSAATRSRRLVVVPGGGALADTVRQIDRAFHLSADASHWMAVKAIDQVAELLADRCAAAAVVADAREIRAALAAARLPVLAPHRWLREVDPLPHSWDATSDSIAAWVAGALGAPRLILVKAPGATGDLVDGHFERACPPGLDTHVVTADDGAFTRLLAPGELGPWPRRAGATGG